MIKQLKLILISLLIPFSAFSQRLDIKGIIVDKGGQPLPGITIVVKGETGGTTSNIKGEFAIKCNTTTPTIVFSMIGFKTQEIKVKDNAPIKVVMEEDNIMLEETIIVGYGAKKTKESLIGSVEQMNAKDIAGNKTSESIDKILEGRLAGVFVENSSGDVGTASSVRVRGQGSLIKVSSSDIVASSEPLYIIDGIPMNDISEPNRANQFGETLINPLALLNPDDIESVTVLKDAATSAIYGANGANGVILITTKKGKEGAATVSVSQSFSYSEIINRMKYLNTEDYVKLAIEAQVNSGVDYETAAKNAGPTDVYTDWYGLTVRNPISSQTNISVSGGSQNVTYRFSGGYSNSKTVSMGNEMNRFTSRLNVSAKLNKKVTLDAILGFSTIKKDIFSTGNFFAIRPNLSPYNEDGSFNNSDPFDSQLNPLAALAQNENWKKEYLTSGSAKLSYQIIDELKLSSSIAVDYNSSRNFRFDSKENAAGRNSNGRIIDIYSTSFLWSSVSQIDFEKTFLEKHNIQALIGFQVDNKETSGLKATEKDLPMEELLEIGLGSTDNITASATESSIGSVSYFTQLSYSYNGRYYLTHTFRRDASSLFGSDQQVENFNSAGASWVISKEPWFKIVKYVPFFKLRVSYGKTGNSRVGSYAARGTYSYSSSYGYNGEVGAQPKDAPNKNLSWEKNYKLTLGSDISFGQRINLNIDYYRNSIVDAISSINLPQESGFSTVSVNAADMRNTGWEFTLKTKNIKKKDFAWNTNFNIATNTNKITHLASSNKIPQSSYTSNLLYVGKDVSSIFAARYAGVDPANGDDLWYLKDGTITNDYKAANQQDQKVIVGKSSPDWFGGFVNDFNYKNLTLSIVMTYQIGGDKMMPYQTIYTNSDGRQILIWNQSVNQLDRWTTPGQKTSVPKLTMDAAISYQNDRFLYDLTNICFKSVTLSYRIPSNISKKIFISNANLNVSINNLGYWYKEKSPSSRNGVAEYRYSFPESRTFTFGLDLRF
ncbi:MAG: SusC/RagA family TonB-linked outer membrane protein [Bacteroidales bacterium]